MKLRLLIFLIIVITLAGIFLYSFTGKTQGQVCFEQHCFSVQIAETKSQQERGLMYVKQLDKSKGMLFIFNDEDVYPFWMKNTLIPLDIIWIDGNNKVVFINQNAQPCKTLICPTINPLTKAKYVLEVNAGVCNEIGLKGGDLVQISPGL